LKLTSCSSHYYLLSASQFALDNCVFFEFHPNFYVAKSKASNEVLLMGNLGSDGLYQFPSLMSKPLSSQSVTSSAQENTLAFVNSVGTSASSALSLWHARLAHPSVDVQRLVLQNCNIPFTNKSTFDSHKLLSFIPLGLYIVIFGVLPFPFTSSTVFQQFKILVENQFPFKIKSLQSDWGGKSRPFTQLLTKFGILIMHG